MRWRGEGWPGPLAQTGCLVPPSSVGEAGHATSLTFHPVVCKMAAQHSLAVLQQLMRSCLQKV